MSKPFVIAFGVAIAVILGVAWFVSYSQRGNRIEPSGRILHVRTVPLDTASSAAIVDFEITNPSDVGMVVRFLNVTIHKQDGSEPEGSAIAASDMPSLFRYHRDELGALGNPPMRERDRIAPHRTVRASTGVRFEMPEADLKQRRDLELSIEDVTGPKLELKAR
jgi:hypothetical protein